MPARQNPVALTRYLQNPQAADPSLLADAVPVVYRELNQLARASLRRAPGPGDLNPTALVHEVYLKLLGEHGAAVNDREHFYALAARAMRQLAVDAARARRTQRRGGDRVEVTLDEALVKANDLDVDLLDLDGALEELAQLDAREAQVVELRFFVGLTMEEIARALQVSVPTVEREWRAARAWLGQRLAQTAPESDPSP